MHHVPPPPSGLLQVATQAQHMGEAAKHRRVGLAFQAVSVVTVVVMGVAASAKLYRDLFGHGHGHGGHGYGRAPDRGRGR